MKIKTWYSVISLLLVSSIVPNYVIANQFDQLISQLGSNEVHDDFGNLNSVDIYDMFTILGPECSFYNYDHKLFVYNATEDGCSSTSKMINLYINALFTGSESISIADNQSISVVGTLFLMLDDEINILNSNTFNSKGILIPVGYGNHRISLIYAISDGVKLSYSFDTVSILILDAISDSTTYSALCSYCNDPFGGMKAKEVSLEINLDFYDSIPQIPITTIKTNTLTGRDYFARSEIKPQIDVKVSSGFDNSSQYFTISSNITTQNSGFGGYQLSKSASTLSSIILMIIESPFVFQVFSLVPGPNILKAELVSGVNQIYFINLLPIGYWFSNMTLQDNSGIDVPHDFEHLFPYGKDNSNINGSFDFLVNYNKAEIILPFFTSMDIVQREIGKYVFLSEIMLLSLLIVIVILVKFQRTGAN